eukprot:CAMPEP_0181419836 /NCGR_PEP_ID=MMETSP1110-20121109/12278_1 /TAXON_ID=174948 /ORGANISM="Symbiodinium sp., Strain CCMP421" /LENGTH=923 /DNA_ID=CAMNT_0023542863 /DNA_START=46 /DNA_END=2815 /DNA_ORIENTATION=-
MATEGKENDTPAEDVAMETAEPAEEPPKELETDAAASKPFLKAGQCCFLTEDTTVNVLPTVNGKLLMAMGDGGFQYLLAGARASVGAKAGRYLFEVMIAEARTLYEPQSRLPGPKPAQLVRIGVSTAESGLILGSADSMESVCFDSTGLFLNGRKRETVSEKFGHSQVAGLLVNLDPSSPNANTVSLFINGVRASQPQKLPETMLGKAVFPAVTFRNVTLQVHFGTAPLRQLPFKCHTWQEVQKAHSEVKASPAPKDGKYQVLLPVGLPDEATFDWVDQFLSKNKNYTEISDRSILDWASKSGLQRSGGYFKRTSHDHPEMHFGLPLMDDYSVSKVLKAFATVLPRNFIIAEVKNNLLADERQRTLARFPSHCYTKEVRVLVGEPAADYKTFIQQVMLKDKKEKAEAEAKRKKAEAVAKQAEEERRKKRLEEQKHREEAEKEGNGAEGGAEDAKESKDEAMGEEPEEKEEPKEEGKVEDSKDEPMEEVHVELTEEEKKLWFRRKDVPDLTSKDMSSSYEKFTLPSSEEGCDKVTFLWYKEAQCKEYLQKWVLERKMTQRVEGLQPSDWFRQKHNEWNRMLGSWKRAHQDFKDPSRRRALQMAKKRKEQAQAKKSEEGKKTEEAAEENGGQPEEGEAEKEKPEEGEEKADKEQPEEPEEMKVDAASLDPFAVEDVTDLGNGEPLFAEFTFEDWMLLSLRFELHLLCHAFRHDLDDPDRPSFKENHFSFYYQKYYKRGFNLKSFGVESTEGLISLIKDTVELSPSGSMETQLSDDTPLDNFVRLTEDARRDRQLRIDSGDELAYLKFQRPTPAPAAYDKGKGAHGKGAYNRGPPPPPPTQGRQPYNYAGASRGGAPPAQGQATYAQNGRTMNLAAIIQLRKLPGPPMVAPQLLGPPTPEARVASSTVASGTRVEEAAPIAAQGVA